MTDQSTAMIVSGGDNSLNAEFKGASKTSQHWGPSDFSIDEAVKSSGLSRTSGISPGTLAPSSFKADPRSRHLKSSESSSRASPLNQKNAGQKIQLPPIRTLSASAAPSSEPPLLLSQMADNSAGYQTSHHSLIPKKRGPSAYAKRQNMTHLQPVIDGLVANGGAPLAHIQNAVVRALAMNAELKPGRASDERTEAMQNQWRNASVGDLEALDSILDQLVVTDERMREALLAGPPISFETVIHEQRLSRPPIPVDSDPDQTFITSVGMEGTMDGEANEDSNQEPEPSSVPIIPPLPSSIPPAIEHFASPRTMHTSALSLVGGSWPVGEDDQEVSREKIPIPILPNLTRMYVTTKQSNMNKSTPPLPPPTAEYLLHHRPSIAAAAPSYDELCDQIKGVQRQYTCGSSKAEASGRNPSPGRSNLDMYISGLDGPTLDQMVLYEDSISLDRTRPTFVAMKKNPQGAKLKAAKAGMSHGRKTEGARAGNIEVVGGGGGVGDD